MAAFKVVQKIGTVTGSNSVDIALKSGYLRVTHVADSFIEVGTNASATTDSSIFVPADESIILKERAVASNFVGITTSDHGTTFTFPSGVESPFAIGDTIEVTNAGVGFNTSKALVTGIGSFTLLADSTEMLEKQPTHVVFVNGGTDVLGTKVGFTN